MKPEAQRIAIAEQCGFSRGTFVTETHWFDDCVSDGQEKVLFAEHISGGVERVPHYLNDLNAMHEAEKVLLQGSAKSLIHATNRYTNELCKLLGCTDTALFQFSHATAAQRAEAFLRTLNLWTE